MRLNLHHLAGLPGSIARPAYDPARLGIGIVHLGIGAFHRAHQAVYTDAAIAASAAAPGDWGICGVSLKSASVQNQLAPQDGLYTLRTVSAQQDAWRVIGSVREVLYHGTQLTQIIGRIARAETRIVSLTVTEKGYCADVRQGQVALQWDHPDIVHDLAHPDQPVSAIGVLVAGLHERFRKRGAPLTVICCDNLPENGVVLKALVEQLSARLYPGMLPWLNASVKFPSSMVDRIVPATQEKDREDALAALGVQDQGVVRAEPFSQWVIEDDFAAERPAWHTVGVQFVRDVRPFEKMKLRLLNGSHSMLAYLGSLAGNTTIAQTASEPRFASLATSLMSEALSTLDPVPGTDLTAYRAQLLLRFTNPATGHRCEQVGMDGSQKIPQRLVVVIRERMAQGLQSPAATLALAGWIAYLHAHRHESIADPLEQTIKQIAARHDSIEAFAREMLGVSSVFGDLSSIPDFSARLVRQASRVSAGRLDAFLDD